MNTLLAIFTCHKYDYSSTDFQDWFIRPEVDRVSAIRDTWLKDVSIDHKFFYGRRPVAPRGFETPLRQPSTDEVFLNVPDDYHHSSEKIQAIVKYALDNGYDRVLKVDDDVYVHWDRVMQNIPTDDYVGGGGKDMHPAGPAYWLSKEALKALRIGRASAWAEDAWVGQVLAAVNITPVHDGRYYIAPQTKTNQYISDEDLFSLHQYLTIHALSPDQMRHYHKVRRNNAQTEMLSQ